MEDFAGRIIGGYLLLRRLGGGAFGEVYLCEHIHRKTQFAMKLLRSRDWQSFLKEARVFRLEHPNIIRVRDFDMHGDIFYIVMDYYPGGTLRERHHPGRSLPLKTLVSYVRQISEALQFAHDDGLVHRDVKPENVLVGARGEVVLSDFGIVTTSDTWDAHAQKGAAGTPIYMSPEQIAGRAVRASDQYALAVLTYEWLIGIPPFRGPLAELVEQHRSVSPPSLCERDPTIQPEVEQVVFRALAKNPDQRFPSVSAYAAALEKAARLPVGTTLQVLQMRTNLVPSLAWSSDGTRLAVAGSDGVVSIWQMDSREPLSFSAGEEQEITVVAWSPDSTRLAVASNDCVIRIWDAASGQVLVTCVSNHEEISTLAWSPDSVGLASAGSNREVRIWNTASGKITAIVQGHGDEVLSVAWSPDGTLLASASYDGTVQVHEMPGQKRLWMSSNPAPVYALVWSPDGTRLAAASYDASISVCEATMGGVFSIYRGHTASVFALSWSPDGMSLASGGDDTTVQIWEPVTGQMVYTYRGHTTGVRALSWSSRTGNEACIASAGLDRVALVWQAP